MAGRRRLLGEDFECGLLRVKLEQAVRAIQDERPRRQGELHVSDFVVNEDKFCLRALVWRYFEGEPPTRVERAPWVFYDGKEREAKWLKVLERTGVLRAYQATARLGRLEGHPDFLIDLGQGLRVLELTGYDPRTPLGLQSERLAVKKRQCRAYLLMLDLPRGIVLAENKGSNDYKLHLVERDPAWEAALQERVLQTSQAIERFENLPDVKPYADLPGCGRKACAACSL